MGKPVTARDTSESQPAGTAPATEQWLRRTLAEAPASTVVQTQHVRDLVQRLVELTPAEECTWQPARFDAAALNNLRATGDDSGGAGAPDRLGELR